MLSVSYIANYLEKDQKNIENQKYILKDFEVSETKKDYIQDKINNFKEDQKESYLDLYNCFESYLDVDCFGLNKNSNKNKNKIFTFFSAIFGIGDENFYLFNEEEKRTCIKNLIHKMDNDIFSKNLYNKLEYDKNKYISKEKISNVLKSSFNFKYDDYFDIVLKYTADYLGINLIFFEIKDKKIESSYIIHSNKFTNKKNEHLPNYLIIKENDEYLPIMIKEKLCKNYLEYEDSDKIRSDFFKIKKMYINVNNSEEEKNLKKMKIDELREYCINNDINIYKTSEKTGKQIKKTKDELLSEI